MPAVTVGRSFQAAQSLRALCAALAIALVSVGCAAPSEPTTASPGPTARVISVDRVDNRTRDLTIDSPAVGHEARVRLLLPAGFEAEPSRRWPILYLLHGASDPDTYKCWTRSTDVAALTANLGLLVVMPETGTDGYYSNWWNNGQGGPPAWETFHLVELLSVLERDWRASDRRAVAGLSMGGLGAMLYAARAPKLFLAAASFSGVLDNSGFTNAPSRLWGGRSEQPEVWRQHNPVDIAADLRGTTLFVSYGNGDPGPLVAADPTGVGGRIERNLIAGNEAFVRRLQQLGIPAQVEAYGAGIHHWEYWQRELHRSLPAILQTLQR